MSVYIVHRAGTQFVKIGYTSGDVHKRVAQWKTGSPEPLKVLRVLPGDRALEQRLHRQFDYLRVSDGGGSEWFRADTRMCEQFAIEVTV